MSLARIITLYQPRRLEIGANSAARVGEWATDAARILVLATPITAGFTDRLGLSGHVTVFDAIPGEPDIATLDAAIARGLADVAAGRVYPIEEVEARLTAKYRKMAEERGL